MLRWFKRRAATVVETGWRWGFWLAGAVGRATGAISPTVAQWSSPGGQRVLVIAPHPDDEACGCGAALLRHRAAGDAVTIVFVTDGRGSRAWGLSPDEMAAWRRTEAAQAAAVLGVTTWHWLGLREWAWEIEDLAPRLLAELETSQPDVIYAPSRVDFHPEHWKTAHALAAALARWPAGAPRVRVMALQTPLGAALTNLVHRTEGVQAQHQAALAAHASQVVSTARTQRMRRYTAAFFGLPGEAEAFWEMPALRYQRLHATAPAAWPAVFRSLRAAPWTDGLAYWQGQRQRQALNRKERSSSGKHGK